MLMVFGHSFPSLMLVLVELASNVLFCGYPVLGVCIGNKIAPIFYNTMEDSGALPLEMSVDKMNTGDVIDIYPYKGVTKNHTTGETVAEFKLKTDVLLDEVRAGGRIPLIIGKSLTSKARAALGELLFRCYCVRFDVFVGVREAICLVVF
jgi:aconitase B